ncbi:MAG TPA: LDL receptor domain-containing protein [Polyangiaceae bacterium]|nr:LDL receptor domain-containing protein [Polyangiaceae bacterium]
MSLGVTAIALNGCFQVGDDDAAAGQAGQAGDDGKTGGSSMGGNATGGSNSAGSSMGGDTSKGGRDTSSFIGRGGTKSSGGAGAKPSSGGTVGDAGSGADGGTGGSAKGGSGGTGGSSRGGSGGTSGTGPLPSGECTDYSAKLKTCGLISTSVDCSVVQSGVYANCYFGCVKDAPCDEVVDGICSAAASNDLVDCVTACADLTFDCGSPGTILAQYVCDGYDDCGNGKDEASCSATTFACGDGTTVKGSARCNTSTDCSNGADEANCPTLLCPLPPAPPPGKACGDAATTLKACNLLPGGKIQGCMDRTEARACRASCFASSSCTDLSAFFCTTEGAEVQRCLDDCATLSDEFPCKADNVAIPANWLCDETADCSDGADEVGCSFTCGDGKELPMSYLCDDIADCADSSDEAGCSATCPAAAAAD